MTERARVGVSRCLLGHNVRYDGDNKLDPVVVEELGPQVEWVPVCPELEIGMGVPREPVRLLRRPAGDLRMAGVTSGEDWTARMERFADARAQALESEHLAGFVLKARSPSCGLLGVKVFDAARPEAPPTLSGTGLFAAALRRRFADLPIVEEGDLADPAQRQLFIQKVLAYFRR
jgi:uncharacterized protein YbbK (DUF523 family)